MTHHEIDVAQFNFEHGGLTSLTHETTGLYFAQGYDLDKLVRAFKDVNTGFDLLVLNEAKFWGHHSSQVALKACELLGERFHRVYDIRIPPFARGDFGPAVIYDPTVLRLVSFGDNSSTVAENKAGVCTFALRVAPNKTFRVKGLHLDFADGERRLAEVKTIGYLADPSVPCLLTGDLNGLGSGPHMRQREWESVEPHKRYHKAWQPKGPLGPWVADTRALDYLIGAWSTLGFNRPEMRYGGVGFVALEEVAIGQGMPVEEAVAATTNTDGGLVIDWMLVNEPWYTALVPGSLKVHVPDDGEWPSDHRLKTATLRW